MTEKPRFSPDYGQFQQTSKLSRFPLCCSGIQWRLFPLSGHISAASSSKRTRSMVLRQRAFLRVSQLPFFWWKISQLLKLFECVFLFSWNCTLLSWDSFGIDWRLTNCFCALLNCEIQRNREMMKNRLFIAFSNATREFFCCNSKNAT